MRRNTLIALLAPCWVCSPLMPFAAKRPPTRLCTKLFDTTWQEDLADDPIGATQLGDPRYNDTLARHVARSDRPAPEEELRAPAGAGRRSIARNSTRPTSSTTTCSSARSRSRIGEYQFKPWMFATRTFDGPQLLAEVTEFAPFKTVKDYDNWINRLNMTGRLHRPVDRAADAGRHREAHAAAQSPSTRCSSRSSRSWSATWKRARSTRRSRTCPASIPDGGEGSAAGRRQGRGAGRGGARRSSASTSSSARSIYPRRATRSASTTSRAATSTTATASAATPPSTTRIAARIHNMGLDEVKRIRGEMEKSARGHQLPRHARAVPRLHPHRAALLLQDAGRTDGGL